MHDPEQRPPSPRKPVMWFVLALALLAVAAVYATSLTYPFLYDDHNQIVNNPSIQSWRYAPSYFTGHVWGHKTSTVLYYRPFFLLWLALNYSLFGLSSTGWHASTLALHFLATWMVYLLARRLTGSEFSSIAAAFLFGLYPPHVEAVDWVSGVTEPLAAVLLTGSFLVYLRRADGRFAFPASLALAAAALLAKETAIVMPGLVFAYRWIYGDRQMRRAARFRAAVLEAAPYVFIAIAYVGLRLAALRTFAHRLPVASLAQVFYTWPGVLAFYIKHALVPVGMSVFYNFHLVATPGPRNFLLPLLVVIVTAAALLGLSIRWRLAAFLSAWMVLLLLPVLNLTLFGNGELVHDRYLYLPSIGLSILIAAALARMRPRPLALAAVLLLGAFYAWDTWREGSYWSSGIALNQRGLQIAPGNLTATHNLGIEYMLAERRPEALPYLLQALRQQPRSEETLFALGLCYFEQDILAEAEQYFLRAIQVDPLDPKPHLFLGVSRAKQKRLDEAESEIRRAIQLQRVPAGFKRYHLALGGVLAEKGDTAGALREYQAELANDPDSSEAGLAIQALQHQAPPGLP